MLLNDLRKLNRIIFIGVLYWNKGWWISCTLNVNGVKNEIILIFQLNFIFNLEKNITREIAWMSTVGETYLISNLFGILLFILNNLKKILELKNEDII